METLKTLAMMMKKQEYMDLEVVGNPTIVDGVVSGFVNQVDYLNTAKTFTVEELGNIELYSNLNFNNDFFPLWNIGSNTNLRIAYSKVNNILFVKIGNQTGYNFLFPNNFDTTTFHNIVVKIVNFKCSIYIDGTLLEEYQFSIPTNLTSSGVLEIGSEKWTYSSGKSFVGNVNIPKCYIIKNGTKYIFTLP